MSTIFHDPQARKPTPDQCELSEVLHRHRAAAILEEATIVRDWPAGADRMDMGARLIREAMLMVTIGKLTRAERDQVTSILAFAFSAVTQNPDKA